MADTQPGIEIHEAHFPGRAPIDAYGNGGFRFAEMSHRGSLLCLPSGIYAWDVTSTEDLNAENFEKLFSEANDIEILLIGSGSDLVPIQSGLREKLRNANISADPMATGAAVRTYNVLISEGRAVAAAFLAVE
ncbi:MAG: Mth938-like domain-containing protein [Rhizobiaceae bacterium]|nr:Mth938-like domain-containing protein [Rhizobiaceae bacterium]